MILITGFAACNKEKALSPSNQDENYLVVKDNPNDPIDHAIYQFYQSTGIPCFYNDTVARKLVGDSAGIPQYSYIRLSLGYSPYANMETWLQLPETRSPIPGLLTLLENELMPRVPENWFIPSILLVDSFMAGFYRGFMLPQDGWMAYQGFNTVAIKMRNTETMNEEERKAYAMSVLTGLAAKRLVSAQSPKLQKDFYSISRSIASMMISDEIYSSFAIADIFPNGVPQPEELAFLHYITFYYAADGFEYTFQLAPREEDDLRMFLYAVLTQTTQAFETQYAAYPSIIQKFRIIREMAGEQGLQLPD